MVVSLPELSLVALVGVSGCGKSTFSRQHFRSTEVLALDFFRALIADDEQEPSASQDALEVLHLVAAKRLAAGRLTVIDAPLVHQAVRQPLVALARRYYVEPVAIVFNLPERLCQERNRQRQDRSLEPQAIHEQVEDLRRSLYKLQREGFRSVHVFSSIQEMEAVAIDRRPMAPNRKSDHGPFDMIGDVHGCYDELVTLLKKLGYHGSEPRQDGDQTVYAIRPPEGRKAIFVGDLVDRGPKAPQVLRLVMDMVAAGTALCVPGNHDDRFLRQLKGRNVQLTHGLAETLAQIAAEPPEFRERVIPFLDSLASHYVLDDGKLVVAHAGMRESMQGRDSRQVRDFGLYGETTGETDEFGLPVRLQWAARYRGQALVVYGHTPVAEPEWLNGTVNIDTGCVYGGRLTALRYPEGELVFVSAFRTYAESARPFWPVERAPEPIGQPRSDRP